MNPTVRLCYSFGAVVLIGLAAYLHSVYLAPEPYLLIANVRLIWWSLLAATHLVLTYVVGLPDLPVSRFGAAVRGVVAVALAFAVIAGFQTLLATPLLPRSSSALVAVLLPIWAVAGWHLSRDVSARAAARDQVFAVVGRDEDAASLQEDLSHRLERPAVLVGWMTVADAVATTTPKLVERVEQCRASLLVLDTEAQGTTPVVDQAAVLHRRGCRIRPLTLFYEEWIGKLPHSELARASLLFDIGELHRTRYVRAKRIVDVGFASVGLILLCLALPFVAVANWGWNRGPLFYRQIRVGKDGKPFEILKLRTMAPAEYGISDMSQTSAVDGGHNGADSPWTSTDDVRITAFGGLLRRSHLDELPQVVNILRGELSLVGPRPEQVHYVEELTAKIAFFDTRHVVRPGLTGWAQVKQGYASSQDDAFDKLQHDFYYLRRQSLGLDARILWRTTRQVLYRKGR